MYAVLHYPCDSVGGITIGGMANAVINNSTTRANVTPIVDAVADINAQVLQARALDNELDADIIEILTRAGIECG